VSSSNECIVDHSTQQSHIHHETRIGHAEYIDYDHLFISSVSRSPISIDYPNGIHYSGWSVPLKLKLILASTSFAPNFVIRCHRTALLSVTSIQTNILNLLSHYIQIDHRQSDAFIDFHVTNNQIQSKTLVEIDLATIIFTINTAQQLTSNDMIKTNMIVSVDWFLLSNGTSNETEPIVRVPIQVRFDDIQSIVALTDFTRLINTAMLSMQIERYPLKILAVNHSG
jgi:hypothetical protein